MFEPVGSKVAMGAEKVLCYMSMVIAGLVALLFLLDAAIGILGRANIVLDVLFIIGAVLVLWQGFATSRELR